MHLSSPYDARYKDFRRLGGGAQATVYRATDTRSGDPVALKLLGHVSGTRAQARLRREAQALSSVVHPHLVRFVDLHEDHQPPILVMEAIEGEDLYELVEDGGALDPARVREVGRAVASALSALHGKGVLHRDIKVENVVLAPGRGPVLVDLGLADIEDASSLTGDGEVVGTPAYLAPEILETREAGVESDVFALGVMLHRMLFGGFPFSMVDVAGAMRTGVLPAEPATRLGEVLGPVAAATLAGSPRDRPTASNLELALGLAPDQTQEHLLPSEVRDRPQREGSGTPDELPGDDLASPAVLPARRLGPWAMLGLGVFGIFLGVVGGRSTSPPPEASAAPVAPEATRWQDTAAAAALARRHGDLVAMHGDAAGEFRHDRFDRKSWKAHLREGAKEVLEPRFGLLVRGYLDGLAQLSADSEGADPGLSPDAGALWRRVEAQLFPIEHLLMDFEYWDPYGEGLFGTKDRRAAAAAMAASELRVRKELQRDLAAPRPSALVQLAQLRLQVTVDPAAVVGRLEALLAPGGSAQLRAARLAALWIMLRNLWNRSHIDDDLRARLMERGHATLSVLQKELAPTRVQDLRVLALAADVRALCFGPDALAEEVQVRMDLLLDDLASALADLGASARIHLEEVLAIFEAHHARKYPEGHPALSRVRRLTSTISRLAEPP